MLSYYLFKHTKHTHIKIKIAHENRAFSSQLKIGVRASSWNKMEKGDTRELYPCLQLKKKMSFTQNP